MPSRFGFETINETQRHRSQLVAAGMAKAKEIDGSVRAVLKDFGTAYGLPANVTGGGKRECHVATLQPFRVIGVVATREGPRDG